MSVGSGTDRLRADAPGDVLWLLAEATAGAVGEEFFQRLVQHVALALAADVAFVAEIVPERPDHARFLACWEGGRLAEPVEYCMEGTPCAEVGASDIVSYTRGVFERFPDDDLVAELGLDSYLAVALRAADGAHLGHLGVLATASLDPGETNIAALRIFAARAAAELERRRHEAALRRREALHRALAEEQAALRRVATLVAAGAPEQELLDHVAGEVGRLLDADVASLVRSSGEQGEIVAGPPTAAPAAVSTATARSCQCVSASSRSSRPARCSTAWSWWPSA